MSMVMMSIYHAYLSKPVENIPTSLTSRYGWNVGSDAERRAQHEAAIEGRVAGF